MIKKIMVILLILAIYIMIGQKTEQYDLIPKDAIRVRVIANSTPRDEITRALVDRALSRGIKKGSMEISAGKDNATAAMYGR